MLVLQVFVMRNGSFEGTEMVQGERIEIGRDPQCALALEDESCSRRHAVLFEHDGKVAIQDLGSANGTRVNGEPVTAARYLGPRDDVAIGVFTLKVKLMSAQAKANVPMPVIAPGDATRVVQGPSAAQLQAMQAAKPSPQAIAVGAASDEATIVQGEMPKASQRASAALVDAARTEAILPELISPSSTVSSTTPFSPLTSPSPPPVPPLSDERPMAAGPDVTSPDAPTPAQRGGARPSTRDAALAAERAGAATKKQAPVPMADFALPDLAGDLPALAFAPTFLDDELRDEELDEVPWSLVQRLVKPGSSESKDGRKSAPLVEVVHYRGELVVDHRVLHEGETFKLGDRMTGAERRERGIPKVIPLVRLKRGGVAEVFARAEVTGRLLRGGQQVELSASKGAVPITDGELASLKVGEERIFIRFAGPPQLLWTKDDAAEDRFARRLNSIALGSSVGLFSLFAVVSWIYQYRNADEEIIAIDDIGFAEVEIKELKMEEPPPEPEKPPEPVPTSEPVPTEAKPDKAVAAPKTEVVPETAPKKPGVLDILNNIPKVNDTASSQNLSAALSNIKGVRVPGGAAGPKVSALIGKGPASGVQIGGAAGGLSTSGINSLIRKDGQAGALGGKGERAIAGKATAQPRLLKQTGGELSKEEIQKVINQHIGEIQYCYEKQLRTQPGLSGRVVLDWTVNLQGKVTVVKIAQSTLASSDATNCMMTKLKSWKFPNPRGGAVSIVFPFVFNTV